MTKADGEIDWTKKIHRNFRRANFGQGAHNYCSGGDARRNLRRFPPATRVRDARPSSLQGFRV